MDSFIFYRSFYEALKELPDNDRLQMYDAICEYALEMSEIEAENPIVRGMFALIKPQIDANYKRKMDGKKGGRPKEKPVVIEKENHRLSKKKTIGYATEKPNVNVNDNVNVNVNENVNVYNKRFAKPSLDEVKSYCEERNNNVDAEKWFNYYSSNGWKVGKNSMKDWKAAVRTWERNSFSQKTISDDIPTYDASKNVPMSEEEKKELLKLMGRV